MAEIGWARNVRELEHTLERAVILSGNALLRPSDFLFPSSGTEKPEDTDEELNLEKLERKAVEKAMRASQGNMTRAAELLGITRFALYRKIEKLGL